MITIKESEMEFGEFQKEDVFQIENSKLQQSFGEGIKTVEFILLHNHNKLLFVEAKKSCPNRNNRDENEEKAKNFEKYFSDISDKFIDSLQMMLNVFLQRNKNFEEIGKNITEQKNYAKIAFRFILVIKDAEGEEWLAGPKEELEARLLRWRKLWKTDILVLSEELATKHGLIKNKKK